MFNARPEAKQSSQEDATSSVPQLHHLSLGIGSNNPEISIRYSGQARRESGELDRHPRSATVGVVAQRAADAIVDDVIADC